MKKSLATWLISGLALVLVVAVAILVILETRGNRRPELYRNLDGHLYSVNTQVRTPGEDGLFRARFVFNGETVEYTVADPNLMSYIDSMEVMGLTVSKDGQVTDAFPADTLVTELCANYYIKTVTPNEIVVNSSLAMNGKEKVIRWDQEALLCDVSRSTSVAVLPAALQPMDGISVYADEKGNVTHIFVTFHPTDSEVYWRTQRSYSTTKKETSRIPDEDGVYTIDFYCEGDIVELKCKDKALVTNIDAESSNPHFAFAFDREGYIVEIVNSALGLRGLLACEGYDVTEITDTAVTAKKLISSKGEVWTGEISKSCKIYDISPAAEAEDRMGQEVESLRPGDRVTLWTDTCNRACQIYITNRLVDSPAYYNVTRKYDSEKKETSRTPDANGLYSVELLKAGDTEPQVFVTDNKALVTAIDAKTSRCVGIAATEKGVLTAVYPAECLFGHSIWASGSVASSITGPVVTKITYGKPTSGANAVMTPDCVVYNMSTTGQYGAQTQLKVGDYFYAFRQPTGELVHIYVVRRCLGPETLYFNLDRQYDAANKKSARTPDENGIFRFTLAHEGRQVTLETDSQELADQLDTFSPGAVSLIVEGNKIQEVNDPKYACGGNMIANNFTYQGVGEDGLHVAVNGENKESVFKLAKDCVIYDIRSGGIVVSSLPVGAKLTGYTDRNGEVRVMFIR